MEADNKGVIAIRWLSFVPGAIFVAFIAFSLVYFGLRLTISTYLVINGFLIDLLSNGVGGAAFVYAGARIAPSHRKAATSILSTLAFLFASFIAYPALVQHDWLHVIVIMALVCGAGLIFYGVMKDEVDLDTH